MSAPLSARTRVFAILGDPVAHTLSPILQNAALRSRELDAVYVALRVNDADVPSIMRTLAGGNVTIPHKGVAADALDRATARVTRTRACNTFWSDGKRLLGDNTDVIGFSVALRRLFRDITGARVLIAGAGGAARAALYALLEDGADDVTVIARNRGRRKEIESVAGRRGRQVHIVASEKNVKGEAFDLVVNATPLGLGKKDPIPLHLDRLGDVRGVFDMVYRSEGTRWSDDAARRGIPAMDGKEMLIQQAAAAFEIWWDVDAPIERMRAAMEAPAR